MALPAVTSRAPVTVAAWSGLFESMGTMAMGPEEKGSSCEAGAGSAAGGD